jgi:hypothetical protein
MNAIQQLDDALQERNKKTNEFLEEIISIINESVSHLPICTRSNSTPEVAGSVKILRKNLDEIIAKIKDDRNIDKHAAEGLMSRLKFSNVKGAMVPEDRSSQSLSGFSGRSFNESDLDGLRFSADRNSQTNVDPDIPQKLGPNYQAGHEKTPVKNGERSEFHFGGRTRRRRR